MKSLIVSASDTLGRILRVINRQHKAFINQSIISSVRISSKQSNVWRILGPSSKYENFTSKLYPIIDEMATQQNKALSINYISISMSFKGYIN